MRQIYLFLLFVSVFAISANAQVTIGSQDAPVEGAVLELKSTELGFLPPRVELVSLSLSTPLPAHVEGMVVYNLTTDPEENLQHGLYHNDGTRWIRLATSPTISEKWFYMPSIVIETDAITAQDAFETKDLYARYKEQLNDETFTRLKRSPDAPPKALSTVPERTGLYYYVTDYDDTVFEDVSIDTNGILTYKIIGKGTDATFMNIVFVEK